MSTNNHNQLLDQLQQKFDAINQNTETHLEGLLWAKFQQLPIGIIFKQMHF